MPPHGKGALYIRPLLLGTGAILGLGPAPEFTFLVYCAPVGAYFKSGQITPISLRVETSFHRAAPGGTGDTKVPGSGEEGTKSGEATTDDTKTTLPTKPDNTSTDNNSTDLSCSHQSISSQNPSGR